MQQAEGSESQVQGRKRAGCCLPVEGGGVRLSENSSCGRAELSIVKICSVAAIQYEKGSVGKHGHTVKLSASRQASGCAIDVVLAKSYRKYVQNRSQKLTEHQWIKMANHIVPCQPQGFNWATGAAEG